MPIFTLIALAIVVAGGALLARYGKTVAKATKAEQLEKDLQAARDRATDAARSAETRHEIDRGDFDDAVDRL
ncbi:hypothetical protein LG047_12645 [Methylocystis sp. WRRC1]|uniref:hypothetical protein n=1 Tax=unclassified Methylocystis TaxID=2625913 RepID=UPI0001F8685A|nr:MULTISPECIES: hypothetical protein [unclassified Methylocystis]MCC3246158.1 hypothetical protein [Methylocystis sp. WRRC1]